MLFKEQVREVPRWDTQECISRSEAKADGHQRPGATYSAHHSSPSSTIYANIIQMDTQSKA